MKKRVAALAFVAAMTISPSAQAAAILDFGTTSEIAANNDFKARLNDLGLTRFATIGSSIVLDAATSIRFDLLGTESGFNDTFFTVGTLPLVSFTEMTSLQDSFLAPILLGTAAFEAGSLAGLLNFSSSGGVGATIGQDGFGIFLGPDQLGGSLVDTFYFGYDDQVTGQDDDYDDLIIRATLVSPSTNAVPEPATWALLVAGFGVAGAALRRRRRHTGRRVGRA
ncbi:MAG TPA: PEPxxWA-CTERM sorting domain-containing protein [Croceibacterium sp.]|nr:PEPxxWA-CTERM sorting domain-containing protein [Croceibacterium sp.]